MPSSETCPNCGADVPPGAKVCPECGSDESTGWSETAYASNLGLPDQGFDYEEFANREFGKPSAAKPEGVRWVWWLTALGLAALLALFWIGSR
jgi:hypothetical protein